MKTCWVCGSANTKSWSDTMDGHTVLESEESCRDCGYSIMFGYGYTTEIIGRWSAQWSYNDSVTNTPISRDAACRAAKLIRRFELGMITGDEAGFLARLAENPADFDAAKIYADWLDEHARANDAHYLRNYDDARGFARKENDDGQVL